MTTDVSQFMWKEFDQQHVDFPEPSMERMFESKFKRNYTVYMLAHFASRVITLDDKFELPDNSILHVADNFFHMDDCIDTPRLDDNPFVQNETYMKYLYHIREFNKDGPVTYEDKYIYRQAGLPSKLLKYRSDHGGEYKYLNTLSALPSRRTALTIINHNPLFRIKVFGRLKLYRRVQQILASILNTIHELAPTGKNQFIVLPWGEEYFDRALFLRSRDKLTYTTIKKPENLHYILMMHLVNYFWDSATTSMFSKLPDETYEKVYFVLNTGNKYVFYNLKALKAMDSNNRIYRKLFNQVNLLSVLGRPNSDNTAAKEIINELSAEDAIVAANKPDANVSEDQPVAKVFEPKIVSKIADKTAEAVDSTVENAVSKLNEVVAVKPAVSTTTGITKTTVSIDVPQVVAPVTDTKAKETKIATVKSATNTTKLKSIKQDDTDISKEYIKDLDTEADEYIDSSETLTPAAKNHFKKVARKYKTLELDGVPLHKILESNSDLALKDTKLDPKIVGDLPDESALECSLHTYDKDYLEKTYKKHLVGIMTSFQKSGVYLVDLKTEKVVTDLHNYTIYSCQYEDIDGKKSTVKFKLPNINEQGIIKIDGVKQYLKKQRFPLPIIKIDNNIVALNSNYNKSRVIKNVNKAHNYIDYIHGFLNDHDKSNCRIHYGRSVTNLPLAYEYTELARKYDKLEFTSRTDKARYTLYFNYPERAANFDGKPDMLSKLEAQYGTYFGKTNNIWLFVDNSNKVSAVKKTGGEADIGCYSILDVCKLALTEPAFNKLKPLSEWVTITILDLNIPVIFMLAYRYGLRNILDYMGVKYTITENRSKTIVGENTIEGTEAFVRDTIIGYEGIWKDNFAKRDAHYYDGAMEHSALLMLMMAKINKKYRKALTDSEATKFIKEHLYTQGSRLVVDQRDLDNWCRKYNFDRSELIAGWPCTQVFGDHHQAASYGKGVIPVFEQMIEDEGVDIKYANFARNELFGHEVYRLDNIIKRILNIRQKGIILSEEMIEFQLLHLTSHEEGHSLNPQSVIDECLRTHTLDATERYAQEYSIPICQKWVDEKLNDKEKAENVPITPSIRNAVKDMVNSVKHFFGVEAFVRDKISGDIPMYDDSIEDYGKDTVVCYEGIWKDNIIKQDPHTTKRYDELDAEMCDILTRVRKKYDKGLTDNEIRNYVKEHLYTKGSSLVVSRQDINYLNKKYDVDPNKASIVIDQIVNYKPLGCSCGKGVIPILEDVFEAENTPLNEVRYSREALYNHEIYFIENIIDLLIKKGKHDKKIAISEQFIDAFLLWIVKHEEGHSATPKEIMDECLRTHTLDATEIYAQECACKALKEWAKDNLLDDERTEVVSVAPNIRSFVQGVFAKTKKVFGLEALGRPVKPRLDKVKLYLTLRSKNVQFNNCQVQVRAMLITVALGTKASCTRRITNYDSAVFTTPGQDTVPRDLVDKAAAYLNCGLRKISKAEVVWIPADKVPDRQVLETPRLTPVEYKKMTSKLCINENKVRPPKQGNEDWSIGFEDVSEDVKYVPKPDDIHIKFADRVLHVNRYPLAHSLIVAGLEYFDLSNYDMSELESKDAYYRLLMDKKLSINYIKGMDSFYELFVDNMTYQVLKMMHEPTTVRDLLIRATVLLTTTDHLPASSGYNHRIRGYEQFAGVVYNELSREFASYKAKTGANNKFSVNPDAVYLRVLQNASMLNAEAGAPIEDMTIMCDMTYGGVGGRSTESFVISDRHYDESDVGVVSEATADNQKVAFNSALSYNPNISNTLGMAEDIPPEKLKASQVFSPHALLFPFSANDD